jgi:coniferyl-aldehyde dehydrogenase
MYAKCLNAGQICITVDHVYVPRAKVPEFVQHAREIVQQRYATLDSPDYTAIIDPRAFERLSAALDEARARGAEVIALLAGAAADPACRKLAPHLVLGLPDDCALMQREIFGPILPILPYDSLQEVVDRIHARPSPLAFYPFTRSRAQADHLVTHVMSGGVSINDTLFHNSQHDLPFGAVGQSGMGHYHGREGFETFSKMRPVFHQARWSAAGLLAPPYGKFIDSALRRLVR